MPIVQWAADEEWREFYGIVSGGSLVGRHGILFVTNYTVGLFADSGLFEGADGVGHEIRQVHDLQCYWPDGIWNEADDFNAIIQVTLLDGATLQVSLFAEEQWRQQEIIELYNHLWHLANVVYIRADLLSKWNKVEAAQEVENHSKVLKLVGKILKEQPYCLMRSSPAYAGGVEDLPRAIDYLKRTIESDGINPAFGHREVARLMYRAGDLAGCKEHDHRHHQL